MSSIYTYQISAAKPESSLIYIRVLPNSSIAKRDSKEVQQYFRWHVNLHRTLKAMAKGQKTVHYMDHITIKYNESRGNDIKNWRKRFAFWLKFTWQRLIGRLKVETSTPNKVVSEKNKQNFAGFILPQFITQTDRNLAPQASRKILDNCGPATLNMFLECHGVKIQRFDLIQHLQKLIETDEAQIKIVGQTRKGGLFNTDIVLLLTELQANPKMMKLDKEAHQEEAKKVLEAGTPIIILENAHYFLLLKHQHHIYQYDPWSTEGPRQLNTFDFKKPDTFVIYAQNKPKEIILSK